MNNSMDHHTPIEVSVPAKRRPMLSRCPYTIKTVVLIAKIAIGALGWKSHTQNGRLPKASKDARDEIRQIAALMSHTTSKLPPTVQSAAKSTPKAVATPLPPLKRRNTGNMCPRMAAPPAANSQSLPAAPSRCRAISTAQAPFPMSPIRVTTPATLPATLSTLVNPMLRLPASRGRSEEHTSELQSHHDLVCRLLLEKKKQKHTTHRYIQQKTTQNPHT